MNEPGQTLAKISEVVNVGRELKQELEHVARLEGRDATSLARKVLRDFLESREQACPAGRLSLGAKVQPR